MNELVTTAELAVLLHRSAFTIRKWKREGTITAEVDNGTSTMLFDPEKVKVQLAKVAKAKARARQAAKSVALPPGMVPTL